MLRDEHVSHSCASEQSYKKYDSIFRRKDVRRQALIAMCLNISHVSIGYILCWTAPVIPKLQDPEQSPLDKPLTGGQISWLNIMADCHIPSGSNSRCPWAAVIAYHQAIHLLVCPLYHKKNLTLNVLFPLGCQISAFLSNIIGRKPTLLLFAIFFLAGHIIRVSASNFTALIIGRIVSGFGGGASANGNLVYIGEIASSDLRGIMLTVTGVHHTLGSLLVFSVGPYVSFAVVEYILIALGTLHVIGLTMIPESPVFHVIKGNEESARNTLHYLGRSRDVDKELKIMMENLKRRKLNYAQLTSNTKHLIPKWTWFEIFTRRRNRRALMITSILLTIQEGAGIICILGYANTIFLKAASSVKPDIATIVLGVTQVVGIVIAPLLVERFGRRSLLIFSTSACAFWMALLGLHFYMELINLPILASIRWIPLATLISFLICYNAGLGIIPNVLVGEMFSPSVRSTGSSISMCLSWIAAFSSSLIFGYVIMLVGSHVIFLVFGFINVIGCVFTLKCVPETRGKSLTEIDEMLAR